MLQAKSYKHHHQLFWLECTPICSRVPGRVDGLGWLESIKVSEFGLSLVHVGPP